MNRWSVGVGALVIVIALVVVVIVVRRPPATTAAAPAPSTPSVPVVTATVGTFTVRVNATGRVGAPAGVGAKLAFAESGIVASIDVSVGERVAAGASLAHLDTSGLTLDVAQARDDALAAAASYGSGTVAARARTGAQARLAAARSKLTSQETKIDLDRRALAREQTLFDGGVAAAKDVDAARQQLALDTSDTAQARAEEAQAESDLRAAQAQGAVTQAQAASAQAKVAAAQRNLGNAVLRAPAAGVVTAIFKHPGESADPTSPALAIGPPDSNAVTLTVTSADAGRIRPGDPVTMSVAGQRAGTTGFVRAIVPGVDTITQTATVVVDGIPPGGTPGDAVEATIAVAARRGIVIPTTSIVEDPQTGKAMVFVRTRSSDGPPFVAREVEVAAGDERSSLIATGLHAGDRIAGVGAYDLLAPGGGGG